MAFMSKTVTELVVIFCRIISSTLFESKVYTGAFYMYYVFNSLLIILQVLHIIWFYFILLIAKDAVLDGQVRYVVSSLELNPYALVSLAYKRERERGGGICGS